MSAHDWLPLFTADGGLRGYVLKARVVGVVVDNPGTRVWLDGRAHAWVDTAEDLVTVFDRLVPKEEAGRG